MAGARFAFDVFSDALDLSSPDARLTVGDQLVDAEYTHVKDGIGNGWVEIHGDHPDAEFLVKRAWVRVSRVDTTPEQVKGGFFLEEGEFRALDKREQVGRVLHFSGPSGVYLFDRYVLGHSHYAPGQTHRGDIDISDKWTWGDVPYGAILTRLVEEGQNAPSSPYAPFTGVTFDRDDDSAAKPWGEVGDYQTDIGSSGLKIVKDFMKLGIIFQVDGDLGLSIYENEDSWGTNRESATFAAHKVRFEAGANILSDLPKRIAASRERTHVLIRGRTGDYQTVAEDKFGAPLSSEPSYTFLKSDTTANVDTLNRMGKQYLTRLKATADQCRVKHLIGPGGGDGAEGYNPGPGDSTINHYWVGDLVTIHTGSTEWDYSEQTIEVAAVRFFLEKGNWVAEAHLGAQYLDPGIEGASNAISRSIIEVPSPLLCEADTSIDTEREVLARLYFSNDGASISPSVDAAWEVDSTGGTHKKMKTTPDGSFTSTHQETESNTGTAGGKDVCIWQGIYGPLSTDEAAAIAAGGLSVRAQVRARMRYGVGISEAAQDGIANIGVRVTTGASATIRGTARALHALGSSAGSSKWPAQSTKVNKQFPPAASSGTLSAVAGTAVGDYLVIEVGLRNFTTVTSGSAIGLTNNNASDLPYDDAATAALNSYVDIFSPGSSDVTVKDGRVELVGTSVKAKRCDDTEHWHEVGSGEPTVDDDVDAGFRIGTLWINDDGGAWLCTDNAAGDATWLPIAGGSSGPDLTGINFLVGTASGDLSAEIPVGTSPGGELGGTWASPTVDATHSGSAHHAEDHNHTAAGDGGDLDFPVIDGYAIFNEESAPGTPGAATAVLYVKSDGRFYSKGDDGVERGPFDAAGAGGGSTGVVVGAPPGFPFVAATATTELTVNQTSHTINLPSGIIAGDLLLLFVMVDGGTTITASGFTSVTTGSSGTDVSLAVLYKFASGSEGATMSITSSASEKVTCLAARIAGHHASTPPEGAGTGSGSASEISNPPSLTPSWGSANDLWIAFGVHDSSNPGAGFVHVGTPFPYLYLWHHAAAAADDGTMAIGYRYFAGTNQNPTSFVAPSGEQWAAATVAVRPV